MRRENIRTSHRKKAQSQVCQFGESRHYYPDGELTEWRLTLALAGGVDATPLRFSAMHPEL